jgi:hypothetical protein
MNPIGRQLLNPVDRVLWTIDGVLRGLGSGGFETQTLVWTSAPLDAAVLRGALARLGVRHPVVTARLDDLGDAGPCWCFHPEAGPAVRETTLSSAEPGAVLDHAGSLLGQAWDPAAADPIRFHLLHRPNGADVFLMQYNHALMDNNAAVLLLQEIDRLAREAPDRAADCIDRRQTGMSASRQRRDLIWDYLRRLPRHRRRQAVADTLRLWGRSMRGGVVVLARGGAGLQPASGRVRLAGRCLGPEATGALHERILRTNGFPSLSMAVAASAFRAIGKLASEQGSSGRRLLAGIGLDLGLRGRKGPIFGNLMSMVPVGAGMEDLEDRDSLVRMLGRQLRERLTGDADLGLLQVAAQFGKRPRPDARWAIEHLLRHGYSLWYGCFGALDAVGERFCGAPVEKVFCTGPAWPPLGLTLLVNQHRGRLFFQATCTPETVPEELAHRFLDQVVGDLIS